MTDIPATLYCENHPQTETNLRCNRCSKPICPKCAISTPTGYRCAECVRNQQKLFETSRWYDYLSATILAGLLSLVGSRIITSFGFFTILLAPVAGVIIAEVVRFAIQRRRSKLLFQIAAIATAVGSSPFLLIGLLILLQGNLGGLWSVLWQGVYTFIVTSTVYYRLGGIQMRV